MAEPPKGKGVKMADTSYKLTDEMAADLLAKFPPIDMTQAICTGKYPVMASKAKQMKCLNFQTVEIEYKDDATDNPAADNAVQFDYMTSKGYKLNMLNWVYEKS
jgi:hypothetical protein